MYKPTTRPLSVLCCNVKNLYSMTFKTEISSVGCMWISLSIKMSMVLLFCSKSETESKF